MYLKYIVNLMRFYDQKMSKKEVFCIMPCYSVTQGLFPGMASYLSVRSVAEPDGDQRFARAPSSLNETKLFIIMGYMISAK